MQPPRRSRYKYEVLIDVLARKSESLPTGTRLPSIRSLMKRYSLTLQTVNTALQELERRGLIERRRNSGLYSRKTTATRHIELHWPLFIGRGGLVAKVVVIRNAIQAAGWTSSLRHHHIHMDDPSDTPDPAASAHLIVPEFVSNERPFFNLLLQQKKPLIVLGRQDAIPLDTIAGTERKTLGLMVGHLTALGHRRIAFLANEPPTSDSLLRQQTFAEILAALDLPPPVLIDCGTRQGEMSSLAAYARMKDYLMSLREPSLPFTALVSATQPGCVGAMRALHETGFSVPGHCSVASLTIDEESILQIPSITESGLELEQWGAATVHLLRQRFEDAHGGPICMELPPRLHVRESTGAVDAG